MNKPAPDESSLPGASEALLRRSAVPLWAQIERLLREMISSGAYTEGSRLPSEPEMASMFGVSRMTVRQAVQRLVEEGRLTRGRGRGTFVSRPAVQREINAQYLDGFFATLTAQGHEVVSRVIAFDQGPADDTVATELRLPYGAHVRRLERLRFVDGTPVSLQVSYLPVLLTPGLDRINFDSISLYRVLRDQLGIRIVAIDQKISARAASAALSRLLQVPPGAPLLYVEKVSRTAEEVPVEFGQLHFNPAHYQLTMAIRS